MKEKILILFAIVASIIVVRYSQYVALVISGAGGVYVLVNVLLSRREKKAIPRNESVALKDLQNIKMDTVKEILFNKSTLRALLLYVFIFALIMVSGIVGNMLLLPIYKIFLWSFGILGLILIARLFSIMVYLQAKVNDSVDFANSIVDLNTEFEKYMNQKDFTDSFTRIANFFVQDHYRLMGLRKILVHTWIFLPDPFNACYRALGAANRTWKYRDYQIDFLSNIKPATYQEKDPSVIEKCHELEGYEISTKEREKIRRNLLKGSIISFIHRNKRNVVFYDTPASDFSIDDLDFMRMLGVKSAVGVPILGKELSLGTFWIFAHIPGYFSHSSMAYAASLASTIGAQLESELDLERISGSYILSLLRRDEVENMPKITGKEYLQHIREMYYYKS
jgi:hypothetical protein